MRKIIITGASGNVGSAIIRSLSTSSDTVLKGSYRYPLKPDEVYFNFDDLVQTRQGLESADLVFLLRPPNISNVNRYFKPLISACVDAGVKHLVFLSVQGVEKSSIIPHNKIEHLIVDSGIPYTFVRPSYFMQNLTTTLKTDIANGEIYLPAGNAPFLWVDVEDIGRAIAAIITNSDQHKGKVYEITGSEYFTFGEVAKKLTDLLGRKITYKSPSLIKFLLRKLEDGVDFSYTIVLVALHYLARFQEKPPITSVYKQLTGGQPNTLDNFIRQHHHELAHNSTIR